MSVPTTRSKSVETSASGAEHLPFNTIPMAPPKPREPLTSESLLPRPRRVEWAELLRRVFAVDVLQCPRCGARMRLLAVIHAPEATRAILECLDLPARAPPTSAPVPDDSKVEFEADWEPAYEAGG